MPPQSPEVPRFLGSRYRLERRIGQGGMGTVYKAQDVTMDRIVAIKLLKRDDSQESDDSAQAERFLREARHTAKLVHEHIVEVYDLGQSDEGELFFVMELLSGEPLSRLLKRERRLEPKRAIQIGMQVCRALSAAHALGIVHRDLKPGNIMLVARPDGRDFVKVLDFGVAKSIVPSNETQLTHTGMLVGTLEYMAPEQIYGRVIDTRVDVYAFGALLYRLLSGTPMFTDAEGPGILNHQLHTIPESLMRRVPEANVPESLDRVVQKCLAKEPERRYQTMKELEAALGDALLGDLSHLPSLEYRDSESLAWDDPPAPIMARVPKPPTSDTRVDRHVAEKAFVNCLACSAKIVPYAIRCPECGVLRASGTPQTPASEAAIPIAVSESPISLSPTLAARISDSKLSVGAIHVDPRLNAELRAFEAPEAMPMFVAPQPWWRRFDDWLRSIFSRG